MNAALMAANGSTVREAFPCIHPLTPSTSLDRQDLKVPLSSLRHDLTGLPALVTRALSFLAIW